MKYDLSKQQDIKDFANNCSDLMYLKKSVELKEVKITRSNRQSRAMHLFFTFISTELNELGMEFQYIGLKGSTLSTRYTPDIVKNYFWRPIQIALFDIESTTKLDTKQMNEITDVIIKFFSERGVTIEFPSMESLMN